MMRRRLSGVTASAGDPNRSLHLAVAGAHVARDNGVTRRLQKRARRLLRLRAHTPQIHACCPKILPMNVRRCAGHGPYLRSAAMCSLVP